MELIEMYGPQIRNIIQLQWLFQRKAKETISLLHSTC